MDGCNGQRTDQRSAQSAAVENGTIRTAHSDARGELTQERLRELMTYDPETGNFIRVPQTGRGHRKRLGVCGCIRERDGYRVIEVDSIKYFAHHLVWLWNNNELPKLIDHVDGNPLNNRIENLRIADLKGNARNRMANRTNKTRYKGVSWYPHSGGCWLARIFVGKRATRLGYYDTPEEAAKAYDRAAEKLHGAFMRPNIDEFASL